MLISNSRASFPLWQKKNLVKHLKKSRIFLKMIVASKHFNKHNHDLNNYRKFIIIELLRNICPTTTETKERLNQPQIWHFSATPDIKYPSLLVNHKFFIWYILRTATAETSQENSSLLAVLSTFPLVQAIYIPSCSRQTDRQTDRQSDRQTDRETDR